MRAHALGSRARGRCHDRPQPPPARAGVAVSDVKDNSLWITLGTAFGLSFAIGIVIAIAGVLMEPSTELNRARQEAADCYAREKATPPRCCTCPVVGP